MRVGFIGTGEIAGYMVQALAGQGHQIYVSARNATKAAELAASYPDVTVAENQQVVDQSDTVFLCLMAAVAREVLPQLAFRPDQNVISVMTDLSVDDLHALCAPATEIACTIPLSAIASGGSMLPVYPASPALQTLFGDTDHVIPVSSQSALNAHRCKCCSLPQEQAHRIFLQYQLQPVHLLPCL